MISSTITATALLGKWHLGDRWPHLPNENGFDLFFGAYYSNDERPYAIYRNDQIAIPAPADQNTLTQQITREALALAEGRARDELDSDRLLNLALVRLLEVVGEAANRVPKEEQSLHPEIPWPSITGLCHRLIHRYGTVDNDILWQVIVQDLPLLVSDLEAILAQDST